MPADRLQKIIATAGVASRRASEALIVAGRVTVNGRPARVGDQVDPAAVRIEVDGIPLGAPAAPIHLALHKPAGVTSTVADRHADLTVLQLLPTAMTSDARLYPVGRLDRDSEGLLLVTNDGEWAERVLHPRFGVEREYSVGLTAWLSNEQRAALDEGMDMEEGRATFAHPVRPASPVETTRLQALLGPPTTEGLAWYRVVLRQGWKRQVRRMFAAVGAPITRLVRVRIGAVRLDDIGVGRYRRLRGSEIKALGAGKAERRSSKAAVEPEAAPPPPASGAGTRSRRRTGPAGSASGRPLTGRPAGPRTPKPKPDAATPRQRPAGDARPERPTRPERPARPAGDARPEGPTRPGRPARPAGDARPERPTRPERPARPAGDARPEGPTRPERPVRPDRPARPDRPQHPR